MAPLFAPNSSFLLGTLNDSRLGIHSPLPPTRSTTAEPEAQLHHLVCYFATRLCNARPKDSCDATDRRNSYSSISAATPIRDVPLQGSRRRTLAVNRNRTAWVNVMWDGSVSVISTFDPGATGRST